MRDSLLTGIGEAGTFEKKYKLLTNTLKKLKKDPKIPDVRLSLANAMVAKKGKKIFEAGTSERLISAALDGLGRDLDRLSQGLDVPMYEKRKKTQAQDDADQKLKKKTAKAKAPGAGDGTGGRRRRLTRRR
jgi:hypothetical protein